MEAIVSEALQQSSFAAVPSDVPGVIRVCMCERFDVLVDTRPAVIHGVICDVSLQPASASHEDWVRRLCARHNWPPVFQVNTARQLKQVLRKVERAASGRSLRSMLATRLLLPFCRCFG